MQKQQPERAPWSRTEQNAGGNGSPCSGARRAIDCGGAADDRPAGPARAEQVSIGQAWLTSPGRYPEQLQAI